MTAVRLTPFEVLVGAQVGIMRRVRSFKVNSQLREPRVDWSREIEGACAELAVAKETGHYWHALGGEPGPTADVGPYHVRHTSLPGGCLILHDGDPPGPFVLVTGTAPEYVIAGQLESLDGRQPRFWRTDVPEPAYFVPQLELEQLDWEVHAA